MKIAIYAIAKNEAAHVARFLASCGEADKIVVCDTGSSDGTWSRLGVHGTRKLDCHLLAIRPWRFDDARNAALALVPDDIDVCIPLDLDEVMTPGWRERIELAWQGVTRLQYPFVWNFDAAGKPLTFFDSDKIHARWGYRWRNPCHECLRPAAGMGEVFGVIGGPPLIEHRADDAKVRDYLDLLKIAVEENPHDDRAAHYYARELFFKGWLTQATEQFERHLGLPSAQWSAERAASLRYIAKCWLARNLPLVSATKAEHALLRAVEEDPLAREGWLDLAELWALRSEWPGALWATDRCLAISKRPGSYISEARCWDGTPEKLRIVLLGKMGLQSAAFADLGDLARVRRQVGAA